MGAAFFGMLVEIYSVISQNIHKTNNSLSFSLNRLFKRGHRCGREERNNLLKDLQHMECARDKTKGTEYT